jgi:hypothetical protein
MGYSIISPEKLSFIEQLKILSNCSEFASTVGSCSHNILFLNSAAHAYLIPRADFCPDYQRAIDSVFDGEITYVDCNLSIARRRSQDCVGPFYLYISTNLMRLFGELQKQDYNYWKYNFKNFQGYVMDGVKQNGLDEIQLSEEYAKRAFDAMVNYNKSKYSYRIKTRTREILKACYHKIKV